MNGIRISTLIAASIAVAIGHGQQFDPAALAQRALQLQNSGDYVAAAEAYRELLKLDPNEVAAHVNLGVVLVNSGHYDEALAEYAAAEKLLPGDSRIELNRALAYQKSGRIKEAGEQLETLHASLPRDSKITMLLADCDLQLGKEPQVIALLEPLRSQDPDDLAISYMLGMAFLRAHQVQEGQKLLDRILRNGDTAESRFLLGVRMYESGDFPEAVKQLRSAVEKNAELPELQAFYGLALLNTGDPEAAADAFRKELKREPNNYAANIGLGQILEVRKQFSEALPLFEHALLLRPESAEAKDGLEAARAGFLPRIKREAAAEGGPRVGDIAPDFELPEAATGKRVHLAEFVTNGPVVLVLGSYSCPNFRWSAEALSGMQKRFGKRASFLLVYIREAHSGDSWESTRNEREGVKLAAAANLSEKEEHAKMCSRKLHLNFPAVVDGMDGATESAYNAWPSRAFVIGMDRRVLYSSRLTELDFHPDEMESILKEGTQP